MPYFKELPLKILAAGLTGRYIHGASMTVGEVTIKAGSELALHQHPHEQITMIIKGELEMTIGQEVLTLKEGMVHVIPSHTLHGAVAKVDCTVIDVFYPVREDYRQ